MISVSRALHFFFTIVILANAPLFAAESIWPMPKSFPTASGDENPAVFPVPRLDWVVRVDANIKESSKLGDSIQVIFDGDSITDGWMKRGRATWDKRYAQYGAFDFGIGGDKTQHVLWRLSQGQAAGLNPKLIAVMIGTNNVSSCTPEQIAAGIREIVTQYQGRCPDAVILLQAIFPRGKLPSDPFREHIKQTNTLIAPLDDGEKVIFVDFGDKFLEPDGTISEGIMPDFLHLSEKGYEIWANAIQLYIDRYLGPANEN